MFDETSSLPVISLATAQPNLWDEEIGIRVLGDDYHPGHPYCGANFRQDWEGPMNVKHFPTGGSEGFSMDLGARIHGGMTRAYDQKTLRLIAREGRGSSHVEYPLCP